MPTQPTPLTNIDLWLICWSFFGRLTRCIEHYWGFGFFDFVCWWLHSIKRTCWCWIMVIDWGQAVLSTMSMSHALFYTVRNGMHDYLIVWICYVINFFTGMMYLYTVFHPRVIPEISSKCASPRDTLNTKYMAPLLWIWCGTTTCDTASVRTGFVRRFCICKMWRMDNNDKEWEPKSDCYVL